MGNIISNNHDNKLSILDFNLCLEYSKIFTKQWGLEFEPILYNMDIDTFHNYFWFLNKNNYEKQILHKSRESASLEKICAAPTFDELVKVSNWLPALHDVVRELKSFDITKKNIILTTMPYYKIMLSKDGNIAEALLIEILRIYYNKVQGHSYSMDYFYDFILKSNRFIPRKFND